MVLTLTVRLGFPEATRKLSSSKRHNDLPLQDSMLEERHDRSGVGFTLYIDNYGLAHPIYPSIPYYNLHLENIRDFNLRNDDVMLLGFPKSGNHWLFEIVTMITYHSVDYTEHTLGENIMDACALERLDSQPSPRVLVSHLASHYLPTQIQEKKTKLVLILRNPKDILVSFYEFVKAIQICAPYRGSFDDFFQLYLNGRFAHGRWIDHVKSFDSFMSQHPDHPVHIVLYEKMKKNPKEEIFKLCQFLGHDDVTDEFVENIVDKTSFANMSQALNKGKLANMLRVFEKGTPGIFRKGIIGDWKHRLSETQNQKFDRYLKTSAFNSKLAPMVASDCHWPIDRTSDKIGDEINE